MRLTRLITGLVPFKRRLEPRAEDSQVAVSSWLGSMPQTCGICLLSKNRPYEHSEEDFDTQYGPASRNLIDKTIGSFLIDACSKTPETVLEIACGTGYLTGSLLSDGRIKTLVASGASMRFLKITKRKMAHLHTKDRLKLVCLSDDDFKAIPENVFDAIMLRSALHHFADFKGVAKLLIGKLKKNGVLCMLEPRADFHIATSLILKSAKTKHQGIQWTNVHEEAVDEFVAAAEFYLDRTKSKSAAEDKYVFHFEELLEVAGQTRTQLSCLGGESLGSYSTKMREFLRYCMRVEPAVVESLMAAAADEIAFMDRAYSNRPRYGAAEWFTFRRY
jgi:ubiquinone/menaquinone biosynthesis C-methylase UbiE